MHGAKRTAQMQRGHPCAWGGSRCTLQTHGADAKRPRPTRGHVNEHLAAAKCPWWYPRARRRLAVLLQTVCLQLVGPRRKAQTHRRGRRHLTCVRLQARTPAFASACTRRCTDFTAAVHLHSGGSAARAALCAWGVSDARCKRRAADAGSPGPLHGFGRKRKTAARKTRMHTSVMQLGTLFARALQCI